MRGIRLLLTDQTATAGAQTIEVGRQDDGKGWEVKADVSRAVVHEDGTVTVRLLITDADAKGLAKFVG